ncbi:MAG: flavodoxin domain-containing protein [Mucilaginibacter polytrichastri]|nr:flavodoxin domain-containing protein [Mucilaginibacter polytrichastri]
MLNEQRLKNFEELIRQSTPEEQIWMSGYLAALTGQGVAATPAAATASAGGKLDACTILYGTETGNSKKIAVELGSRAKKQGAQVKLKSLDQYRPNDLKKEKNVFLVVSTHGDGEPPEAARKFYDYVHTEQPELKELRYGVLALGDSSYPLFCKTGEDLDAKLNELGASRIVPLQKCDTDFEADAQSWIEELLRASVPQEAGAAPIAAPRPKSSGKKIYAGKIIANINLNDRGSNKVTHHIEIESEDAIQYEPGDSIGIVARNHPDVVARVLSLLEIDPQAVFTYKNSALAAGELFSSRINLNYLPERVVSNYARFVAQDIPVTRMDFADLVRIYPPEAAADKQALIDLLEPIAPRLYSISSSPASHGENEVHVTVSQDRFEYDGQQRKGLCSDYLVCLGEGDTFDFYVQRNTSFKLPDGAKDVIMIGPGTGVAPFRSFLFERDAQGADGRNWLFFGDQHFVSDFLYQTELQSLMETGVLTRLNTAFSRDQQEKVYVQHRMQQHAGELVDWLESGAHIYVCGAKDPMSRDVEETLVQILADGKKIPVKTAQEYLAELSEAGRYVKDVY